MFMTGALLPQVLAASFAYIPNHYSNSVSVIDTSTNTVVATPAVGNGPFGVAVNPTGTRVYITNLNGGTVSVLDTSSNTVIATITVGENPYGITVTPNGSRVYVANWLSNTVSAIDTNTNTVTATIPVGAGPFGIDVNPAGSCVYVTNNAIDTLSVIDTSTNTVITDPAPVSTGDVPWMIAITPSGNHAYVAHYNESNVLAIDTNTNSVVSTIPLGGITIAGLAVNPSGSLVYAANSNNNTVQFIDTSSNTVAGAIPVGSYPYGLAITPSGSHVYVANHYSDTVSAIDTVTNTVVATIPVGSHPVAVGKFIGPNICTPPPSGMFSWLGGDNNALDMVGANHGTLVNGTTYAAGMVDQAFSLDGEDDYVNIPNLTSQKFPAAFTIGAWIKATVLPGDIVVLAGMPGGYQLDLRSNGKIAFGNAGAMVDSTASISNNTFVHVAASFDAGNVNIYINGVLDHQGTTTTYSGGEIPFQVGGFGDYANTFFNGMIDELELYNRALTAEEIAAIYNAGSAGKCRSCTPPPTNMAAWWKAENNADDSVSTNNGTVQNGTTYAAGKVDQAFSLDGVDAYVEVPHNASLSFPPASPMSFDLWVYRTSTSATQHIFSKRTDCTYFNYQLALDSGFNTGLCFGGNATQICTTGEESDLPLNTWTHIAGTSDETTLKLYVNGKLAASRLGSLGSENEVPLKFGAAGTCGTYPFGGLIDEMAIYSRTLSAEEIAAIYNAGSAGTCDIDTTPDAFTFTDQTGGAVNTLTLSNTITVSGINSPADISISSCTGTNCEYQINGDSWTSTASTVNNNDTVTVRQTSSSSYATTTNLSLDIGGATDTFSITTIQKYIMTPGKAGDGSGTITSDTASIDCISRPEPGINDGTDTGTSLAGKDAFGGTCSNPGYNNGDGTAIYAAPITTCNECNSDAFIQFDLASLPATVEHVYLGVTHYPHDTYCYSNCDADFYFYPLTSSWSENTVSLTNNPTASTTPAYGPINITFPNDFGAREYEITDLYQQWKDGSIPNYGIEISSPTIGCNNASVAFYVHSSDSEIGKRPYLRIVTATSVNNECAGGNAWNYASGAIVTLTATPDAGSTFTGWSGDADCDDGIVTINANTTCTATFAINTYTVSASAGPNGSISPANDQTVNHGTTTTFTVTPDTNYTASVSCTCGGTLDGTTYTTNAVTSDCTVIATFTLNSYPLTINKTGIGTVTSSPSGIICGTDCSEDYNFGTDVTLTATPATGSIFTGWTGGGCTGTGVCTVTMDEQKEISASFLKDFPWPMFLPAITKGVQ